MTGVQTCALPIFVVHKVGGISQHKVKNKHGDDKADYDYPTGGSDAFKRGCFFLSSFHDEKFNCWYLNRVLKIKHRDTTSRLRTDRA